MRGNGPVVVKTACILSKGGMRERVPDLEGGNNEGRRAHGGSKARH